MAALLVIPYSSLDLIYEKSTIPFVKAYTIVGDARFVNLTETHYIIWLIMLKISVTSTFYGITLLPFCIE